MYCATVCGCIQRGHILALFIDRFYKNNLYYYIHFFHIPAFTFFCPCTENGPCDDHIAEIPPDNNIWLHAVYTKTRKNLYTEVFISKILYWSICPEIRFSTSGFRFRIHILTSFTCSVSQSCILYSSTLIEMVYTIVYLPMCLFHVHLSYTIVLFTGFPTIILCYSEFRLSTSYHVITFMYNTLFPLFLFPLRRFFWPLNSPVFGYTS